MRALGELTELVFFSLLYLGVKSRLIQELKPAKLHYFPVTSIAPPPLAALGNSVKGLIHSRLLWRSWSKLLAANDQDPSIQPTMQNP